MAQDQVPLHPLSPQVDVAVPQTRILGRVRSVPFGEEWGGERAVEDFQVFHLNLDLAGCHLRINVPLTARSDRANDRDYVLSVQSMRLGEVWILPRKKKLDYARAVA